MKVFPKVSILIPTYCQEEVVSNAILSALAQKYPNFEVIVIDDASPDKTSDKVSSFNDSRLRYIRNANNLGRVQNYRRALYELSTGEWVVNLDGDDYFTDPEFIAKAIKLAYSEPGIVIVTGQVKVVTKKATIEPPLRKSTVLLGKEALLRYHNQIYHFPHMATVYHRPSALVSDFYRMDVISSDWESLLRLAIKGKVAYLDNVIGCWNLLGNNSSLSNCWKDFADNLKIWDPIYTLAEEADIPRGAIESARYKNLLSVAYRDLCQIFKGGAILGAFKYLYLGFSVLRFKITLRIIFHPYFWVKIGINAFRCLKGVSDNVWHCRRHSNGPEPT